MKYALQIDHLCKQYDSFCLDDVNLSLPTGCIMGFIGENGAGKSTTIKLILNLIHKDDGQIQVLGMDHLQDEMAIKQQIGIVLDESNFPANLKTADVGRIMKHIYSNWDEAVFQSYLTRFGLPANKTVQQFSHGMKMKLSIAVALSHHARLLILDEATSGLDPIVREEILDVFMDFIEDEEHSVFLSSHITSDLEKITDYIALIHQGKIVFSRPKDELLDSYGILKCGLAEFEAIDPAVIQGYRKNRYGVEALVQKNKLKGNYTVDPANLEQIMLYHVRGEKE